MAAGEEVDAELAGGVQSRLLRLAGDEGVVSPVRRLDQPRPAAACHDRDALDPRRALGEDERLASGRVSEPRRELVDRHRLVVTRGGSDSREIVLTPRAEQLCE